MTLAVNFIDYAFDSTEDVNIRFAQVQEQFLKLLEINLDQAYKENYAVFEHNQNCINTIPYDTRILEIFNV